MLLASEIEARLREFAASAAIEVRIWLLPHYDFIPPPMRYLIYLSRDLEVVRVGLVRKLAAEGPDAGPGP